MISAPKGVLRLAALKLLSESSLSGTDLAKQMERVSGGRWRPGPGSVYLMLKELHGKGLITELPKRGGTVRRYIITSKGKDELAKMSKETGTEVARQLGVLSVYSRLAGRADLSKSLDSVALDLQKA